MTVDEIRTLVAYNHWANRRLLGASRAIPPDDFGRDLRASFGSVKGTLVHLLAGEWHWLRFFQDRAPGTLPAPEDFADAPALADAFSDLEREQGEFVGGLTEPQLWAPWELRGRQYTLAQLLQHVVNHSSYHRGQVSTLLRQLGHNPPATDFRIFLDQAPVSPPHGAA